MTVFHVHTVDGRDGRDSWGVFTHERGSNGLMRERRVYGPANVYDCQRERARLIAAERRGECVVLRGEATNADDPLYVPGFATNAIRKVLPVSELPPTITRWLSLGRKVTGISPA